MITDSTPPSRIGDYMAARIRTVDIDATLKEAAGLLERWRVGCLLVRNGARYAGMVTDTDLSRKAVARGLDPSITPVSACMTKPIIGLEETEPMASAIELMKEHGIPNLVVTKGNQVIGILSVAGVVRYYSELLPVVHSLARRTAQSPPHL
jgi:CBS domain-containing protein